MKTAVLIGAGGHALSTLDCVDENLFKIIGYTDKCMRKDTLFSVPYLGTDYVLRDLLDQGVSSAICGVGFMGGMNPRSKIYYNLKNLGFELPIILDESATVSRVCEIGEGALIGKNTTVNAGSVVGKMSIINTSAVIEHENIIGDFCHISVNTTLCGGVCVGDNTFIGAGTTVIQGVHIGANVVIGAGSLILNDVKDNTKVYGVYK